MVIEFNIQGESEEGYILASLARGSLFIKHGSPAAITNA
jgi:hypothetical protein